MTTSGFLEWIDKNTWQLLVTIALLAIYLVLDRLSAPHLAESAQRTYQKDDSAGRAVKVARVITGIFGLLILTIVWGFDFSSLMFFATTAITLLGVALFASWSILSNVTAYFILVLHPSYRRGNFIRVFEADNYVEGYIADITLLSTKLVTEDREAVIYPNNLLLGRPALINPRDRLKGIGKLTPPAAPVGVNADPSAAAAGTAQRSASGAAEEQKP